MMHVHPEYMLQAEQYVRDRLASSTDLKQLKNDAANIHARDYQEYTSCWHHLNQVFPN